VEIYRFAAISTNKRNFIKASKKVIFHTKSAMVVGLLTFASWFMVEGDFVGPSIEFPFEVVIVQLN
jgi:hypothetical protein